MSIAKKLLLLVAAALAGLIGVTLLGLHQINQVYESANYCNVNSLPSVLVLDKAVDSFAKLQSLVVQHLLASDDEQKHRLDTQLATAQTAIEAAFKEYEPLLSDDHDKQMLDNDRHALADYAAVSGKALAASNAHNDEESRRELAASTPAIEKLTSLLQAHREYNVKLSDQGDKDAQSAYHTARLLAVICGLVAVALSTVLGLIISRSIVNPIRQSIGIANRIASGDLTAHINNTSQDEAGQMLKALDVMQASLRQAIVSIQECAESLTESASCMAASSEQLRARSSSQSTATGNMAAAIEELTVSIGHVKDNAGDAENASSQAGTMSEDGAAEVSKTATDIQSIAQEIRSTATTITALGDETQNISSIVSVIREVADQTNLLALNAAIEAARAGEQGRGFAVVADEVRKLAERTRSATQEIAGKIERVQKGAAEAIASMNHSMGRIGEGVGQTHHAAEAIKNISMSARQAAQSVALIATTLNEQASASLQIAGNVERVAQMTEENSTAAIAAANAAKSLTDLAATMRETVSRFHLRES